MDEAAVKFDSWKELVDRLRDRGIRFEDGLSDDECCRAEQTFGFRFPDDLREFLRTALPVGDGFPNWRSGDDATLRDRLSIPCEGVLFDIEYNGFWLPEWGDRPPTLAAAKQRAEEHIAAAPRLIPIYSHRMMPDAPQSVGNPVFSVHQTDIIIYGCDLHDYFHHEFFASEDEAEVWNIREDTRRIAFWDTERFQKIRWGPNGMCIFDNRRGLLP